MHALQIYVFIYSLHLQLICNTIITNIQYFFWWTNIRCTFYEEVSQNDVLVL